MLMLSSITAAVVSVACFVFRAIWKKYLSEMTLPDGSPTIDESVTRPMLAMARTCAKMCRAIYGRYEDLPLLLAIDGWKHDRVIASEDLSTVCGFVYRDDGPAPSVIVIWRGTNILNRAQVRANAKTKLVGFSFVREYRRYIPGLVHAGVRDQLRAIEKQVMAAIRFHVQRGRKIFVAGHSQGGAIAVLNAAMMLEAGMHLAGLVTFGSPRPGDREFCNYVNSEMRASQFGHLRFRNNNDIVPLVPPYAAGYCHPGEELYIWPGSMITRNPGRVVKVIQRLKPIFCGILWDGFSDHAIAEYCRHLEGVRI